MGFEPTTLGLGSRTEGDAVAVRGHSPTSGIGSSMGLRPFGDISLSFVKVRHRSSIKQCNPDGDPPAGGLWVPACIGDDDGVQCLLGKKPSETTPSQTQHVLTGVNTKAEPPP